MSPAFARCLLALYVAAVPFALDAQPRGFDVRDLVVLDRASATTLSPDGGKLVFAVREVDFDANKASTGLWLRDLRTRDDAPPRRFTPEGFNVNSPSFSGDGATVYFLSSKSGSMQLWAQPVAGGEPVQVTDYALDVGSYRLSPDGTRVALSFEVFPDCVDLACTKQRLDAEEASPATGQHYDRVFVRHWDTWKDGRRSQLFVAPLSEGKTSAEPRRVSLGIDGDIPSRPFGDAGDYAWAPDGQSLVFAARIAGSSEPWSTNFDLFRVPADASAAPVNLTADNPAWDAGPVFSADGRTLYYRAMARPMFEADRFALIAMDVASGEKREIAPGWDRSADGITLSDDGRTIYTTTNDIGEHALFAIDIASGRARKVAGGGSIGDFDLARGTLAFTRHDLAAPAQVFVARADGGNVRQITRLNADKLADVKFGGFEQFSFKGWNDETVYGWVVKPWNYEPGKKYPVAFLIHGGPQGSMGNSFHYRWNAQTYAGQGFAAVFIDFHGSTGYGQAFTDSISGDWGGKPLIDLQRGFAAAQDQYDFLDGERACALGGSYGGFMVNWIAGNWPDGFDCLVNHAGIFDNRMMYYATEETWFVEWEHGGPQYLKPENFEKHNPVSHVADWKTPMLVIHGQRDYRVPVEQGLASFGALQRRGIPGEFLYFPDENHWILKPHNSVQWHDTVNAWLKRWTQAK